MTACPSTWHITLDATDASSTPASTTATLSFPAATRCTGMFSPAGDCGWAHALPAVSPRRRAVAEDRMNRSLDAIGILSLM